ncbi:hypothetical protein ACFYXL_05785 [Streptomyces tsukubensis]|uniref:hypothetical protein n=1 Tax=Streptomyces tsukubensis TaxID=83656 RepID=UPI0036A680FC
MRDLTFRALAWVLNLIVPPGNGRHRPAPKPKPAAAPDRITVTLAGLADPFERIPGHAPGHSPIPPYRPRYIELAERFKAERWERTQQHERQLAAVAVTYGAEYEYSYPDALMIPAAIAEAAVSA